MSRFVGLSLMAITGAAVGGEFEPTLSVGVIRTDNVTLVPVNPEQATVVLLRPGFTYTQDTAKLTADVEYRMDGYHYQQRGENEIHNVFGADLGFGMVPDRFFLDFGGSRSQVVIDPEGLIPFDNLAISTNRTDRDDAYVGPSFHMPVGDNVLVNGDFRHTWVRYDSLPPLGGFEDYESDEGGLSVDNYARGVGLSWAARYFSENADYGERFAPYEYQQASVELGFWVNMGTRLFLLGGQESAWDAPLDSSLEYPFWEVGVVRELGERFKAEFAAGDRSFGSSGRVELDYDFGSGSTALSYSEGPTTDVNDSFSSSLLDPDEPTDYLSRAGSGERYISRLLQWSVDFDWGRYELALALFDESRDDRTQVNGVPLAGERQSGADLSASWQVGSRTELYLRARGVSREFDDGEKSDLAWGAIGASYRLGERMKLALEVEGREQTSARTAALNYRENLTSLVFAQTF